MCFALVCLILLGIDDGACDSSYAVDRRAHAGYGANHIYHDKPKPRTSKVTKMAG
jgi:hypothetical protein